MELIVSERHSGARLDIFISESWDRSESRSEIQRRIKAESVRIDGRIVSRASARVDVGQLVQIVMDAREIEGQIVASSEKLNVAYEDRDIAVIDKPAGMTVHPGAGHGSDTLVNAAIDRWPHIAEIGEPDRPGIVHRLDQDTSGLLIIALSPGAYLGLSEMIRERKVNRIYTALVHGIPASTKGVVDAPVGRDLHHRTRQAIVERGRESRTHYRVLEKLGVFSLLEVRLETGRMHQIRVHMQAIGHPVVGDQTYGRRTTTGGLTRQFLHASQLVFAHPVSGEQLSLISDLPDDLRNVLSGLREIHG
ncbi:MAG: RluA family pseudouridine synthase [Chloroflexi bacterium]|nr:RluA family pseudouridine synthase [Chloroflexota bacterium]